MTFGKIGASNMLYHWKNPYVTNGLVAMWDGIWNAGPSEHDQNEQGWYDLSGNRFVPHFRGVNRVWNSNHLANTDGLSNEFYVDGLGLNAMLSAKSFTLEVLFERISGGFVLCANNENARGAWVWGWNNASPNYTYWQGHNSTFPRGRVNNVNLLTFTGDGIYVNGTLAKSISSASSFKNGNGRLMIGCYQTSGGGFHSTSTSNLNYYRVAILDRTLTAAEVAHNYAVDVARFNLPAT